MISVAKSNIKNILYILFCFLLTSIPLGAEAKVEKIGTKDLKILLPKDYDVKRPYTLTLPLRNISNENQKVSYELNGFKTKENKSIIVKLYEAGGRNPDLTYTGAPVITKKSFTFAGGEEKFITLEFIFDQVSDDYSGDLTIYSFTDPSQGKPGTSASEKVSFAFIKFIEPKKELPEKALEVNFGSNEPIRINKVISLFSSKGDEGKNGYGVNLANKTKEDTIKNVIIQLSSFVRTEGDKKVSQRFDLQAHKTNPLSIEGNKSDVLSLPLPRIRRPGTYNIKFNIEADGVKAQQVEAIVQAKYRVRWAVLIILLGAVLSYFVTRGFVMYRTKYVRSNSIKRIRKEVEDYTDDNEYLKERIRALASISEDLNKSWIFISEDRTKDFLELAKYLLEVGNRKGEIWYKLQEAGVPQGLVEAASVHLKEVDRLVAKYDVLANKEEIKSRLDKAEEYTKQDKGASYWLKLKQRIEELLKAIEGVGTIPNTSIKNYIEELKNRLDTIKDKPEMEYDQLKSVELTQRKLDLVWEYKDDEGLQKAIEAMRKNGDDGLKTAIAILKWSKENETNWEKIKEKNKQGRVRINRPLNVIEDEVGVFTVDFNEERLNNSYLVRRGLVYGWVFSRKNGSGKPPIPVSVGIKTNSVGKYFPDPGTWEIAVTIKYEDETTEEPTQVIKGEIRVKPNEDKKWIKQISKAELGLFGAALGLALLSGLKSEYLSKADFGSPIDFVNLFLWAVALDQAKNFAGWLKGIGEAQKQPYPTG
jgi:hypothetical protein